MPFTINNDPVSDGQVLGSISFGYTKKVMQKQLVSPEVRVLESQVVSPVTPEFTYEDARRYKYKVLSSNSDSWAEDLSAGAKTSTKGWLSEIGEIEYYEMSSIRQVQTFPFKLKESTSRKKIDFTSGLAVTHEFAPIRIDFNITDSEPLNQCYRLYRKSKKISEPVSLGFHCPDPNISFEYSGGSEIDIKGLDANTHYRLSWHCYSGSQISFNGSQLKKTKPATGSSISFSGENFPKISFIKDSSSDIHGADLWLEKNVDSRRLAKFSLWSFVAAAEIFHYDTNYQCNNCSFLDCFDKTLFNLSI